MNVEDLMSSEVITMHADSVLTDAEEIMGFRRFRHLPVVDGPQRRLVGLLTHRDLARAAVSSVRGDRREDRVLMASIPVREVMHTQVETILASAPLQAAAERMRKAKYGCLPVVDDDDRLVGILTEADFVRLAEVLLSNLVGDRAERQAELKGWFHDS